ncbi:MAG: hypothetical protein ACFFCD_04085 [Promethearchaeota archaeon]
MSEKCRYGRDSEVNNGPLHVTILKYECPNDADVDGFAFFTRRDTGSKIKRARKRKNLLILLKIRLLMTKRKNCYAV